MKFGIGQPVPRKEDPKFLTGRGQYVGDFKFPDEAFAFVLRSPHANARIVSLTTDTAKALPGVLAVLTGEDYVAAGLGTIKCVTMFPFLMGGKEGVQRPFGALVSGEVKCVGAPVAFVIAETLELAKDAAELIEIEYSPLPSVSRTNDAPDTDAPQVWDDTDNNEAFTFKIDGGTNIEAALSQAPRVITATLTNNRVNTNSMEPRASIGLYDPGTQKYTLYTSNQAPNRARQDIAGDMLNIPEAKLQVIAPDVGGGFGMKGVFYSEDVLVLWGAQKTGRPVKWIGERYESFTSDSHGRDMIAHCEMAVQADGLVTGLKVTSDYNVGAYLDPGAGVSPMDFSELLSGVYAIPAINVTTRALFSNMGATAPYRGAGRPEAAFVLERMMDIAARRLGLDPIDIRRRNLVQSGQMPYETVLGLTLDCGDFEVIMDKALEISDWSGFPARKNESEARGKLRGRGLSVYLESAAIFNERMELRFDPGGDVTILAGTHSHGQGHETVYAQMVSDFLGVPFERVFFIQGDTDKVAMGRGTIGSRSITVGGAALRMAADTIIVKGKEIAGYLLEAAASDIVFEMGEFTVSGTDKSISIVDVAKSSFAPVNWPSELGIGLEAVGDHNSGGGNYPNGCQVAEVEIDPDTGKTELVNLTIVSDVGTVINPLLLAGQIHGGVAQGIGQAMLEDMIYDAQSGQLLTASFLDYAMPRADDLPTFAVEEIAVPTSTNSLGVKGAGETGTVGAPPAVIGAICDALDVDDIPMPATPERIWRALNSRHLP